MLKLGHVYCNLVVWLLKRSHTLKTAQLKPNLGNENKNQRASLHSEDLKMFSLMFFKDGALSWHCKGLAKLYDNYTDSLWYTVQQKGNVTLWHQVLRKPSINREIDKMGGFFSIGAQGFTVAMEDCVKANGFSYNAAAFVFSWCLMALQVSVNSTPRFWSADVQ